MTTASFAAEWDRSIVMLRSLGRVPAAVANANLLSDAKLRWCDRLVARTSMFDLLFTRPGDVFPFPVVVRVAAADDVFEFQLRRRDLLVTADRGTWHNAPAVLDAFLMQLDTGSAAGD